MYGVHTAKTELFVCLCIVYEHSNIIRCQSMVVGYGSLMDTRSTVN